MSYRIETDKEARSSGRTSEVGRQSSRPRTHRQEGSTLAEQDGGESDVDALLAALPHHARPGQAPMQVLCCAMLCSTVHYNQLHHPTDQSPQSTATKFNPSPAHPFIDRCNLSILSTGTRGPKQQATRNKQLPLSLCALPCPVPTNRTPPRSLSLSPQRFSPTPAAKAGAIAPRF